MLAALTNTVRKGHYVIWMRRHSVTFASKRIETYRTYVICEVNAASNTGIIRTVRTHANTIHEVTAHDILTIPKCHFPVCRALYRNNETTYNSLADIKRELGL